MQLSTAPSFVAVSRQPMITDGPGAAATVNGKANAACRYMLPHWALTTVQCAQSRVEEGPGTGIEFVRLGREIRRPDE